LYIIETLGPPCSGIKIWNSFNCIEFRWLSKCHRDDHNISQWRPTIVSDEDCEDIQGFCKANPDTH
jgi:hypothetical protein